MAKLDLTLTLNSENELEYIDISEHPSMGDVRRKRIVFLSNIPLTRK